MLSVLDFCLCLRCLLQLLDIHIQNQNEYLFQLISTNKHMETRLIDPCDLQTSYGVVQTIQVDTYGCLYSLSFLLIDNKMLVTI